ncbi:hypothetical protein N9213_02365 [Akkermansiaceae bacterium]|nr:hypothetical protein [Akkermansiaceae bacterium]
MMARIARMRLLVQVCLGIALVMGGLSQEVAPFKYEGPQVRASVFTDALGMVNRERTEYATNLAIFAGDNVITKKANPESLALALRVTGLALHLSPRNKRALILNGQLKKGVLPKTVQTEYSPDTLAHLLISRAEVLYQQKGGEDKLLARAFIDLAASIDPSNEDAIYAFELQKIDHGEVPWKDFTAVQSSK